MFTHDSQADRILPGEQDMWSEFENNVSQLTLDKHVYDSSDSAYNHNTPSGDSSGHDGKSPKGVHLVTHIGNFLSVDRFLRTSAIQLLHEICNDDVAVDVWKDQLNNIEAKLRNHYRTTMTDNPSVSRALRLCGHVFLCGPSEAGGSGLDDLFAAFFTSTIASTGSPVDDAQAAGCGYGGSNVNSDVYGNGSNLNDDSGNGDDEVVWNSVGEAANAGRESLHRNTVRLTRDQQQAAKLIHGMLLRVARLVC
jgi:hypothetical protein